MFCTKRRGGWGRGFSYHTLSPSLSRSISLRKVQAEGEKGGRRSHGRGCAYATYCAGGVRTAWGGREALACLCPVPRPANPSLLTAPQKDSRRRVGGVVCVCVCVSLFKESEFTPAPPGSDSDHPPHHSPARVPTPAPSLCHTPPLQTFSRLRPRLPPRRVGWASRPSLPSRTGEGVRRGCGWDPRTWRVTSSTAYSGGRGVSFSQYGGRVGGSEGWFYLQRKSKFLPEDTRTSLSED